MHFGTPKTFEKECFTRVLKGQIRLAQSIFPTKIIGNYLDTLARISLWEVGLDYSHGTGHGVGAYLNVHEGPMGISWRPYPDDPGLQEGMVLSNEPSYYMDNNFLTFENLTVVPIQVKMILANLLSKEELEYF